MAEQQQKNGDNAGRSANPGGPKRTQGSGQTSASPNETSGLNKIGSDASEASRSTAGVLARRKRQYLVATRVLPGLAAAPASEDCRKLFNQLLAWGLSMAVVGALVCYLMF